jgi:hypothetical protein
LLFSALLGAPGKALLNQPSIALPSAPQVALTMCGAPRQEAAMLPLLKRAVLSAYATDAAGAGFSWMPAPAGASEGVGGHRGAGASLEQALLAAVRWARRRGLRSGAGALQPLRWPSDANQPSPLPNPLRRHSQYAGELVAPGALALGRLLLACHVDCPLHLVLACGEGAGAAAGAAAAAAAGAQGEASPGTRAVRLGLLLLGAIFEHQPEARDEVLRSCQVRGAGCGRGRLRCSTPSQSPCLGRAFQGPHDAAATPL